MPLTHDPNVSASTDSNRALDVVIVNWNSGHWLRECLAALDRSTLAAQIGVTVVDNASDDDSATGLAMKHCHFRVVANQENCGFAAACNQGSRYGTAPVLLFLNPDVMVERDSLATAVAFLKQPRNDQIGVVGVQLLNTARQIQRSCARTPTLATLLLQTLFLDRLCPRLIPTHFLSDWNHADTRPVDQVMGACLMICRPLYEAIGGFDERFFLYYEDVELCTAVRRSGFQVVYLANAQAIHVGGASTNAVKGPRLYYQFVSRIKYTAKHHGAHAANLLTALIFLFEFPLRWLYATMLRSSEERREVIRGTALFWQDRLRNRGST